MSLLLMRMCGDDRRCHELPSPDVVAALQDIVPRRPRLPMASLTSQQARMEPAIEMVTGPMILCFRRSKFSLGPLGCPKS